ncbi:MULTISPECIES: transposase [unclassified Bradyrhizobium]
MDTVHTAITEPVRRLEVFTGAGRRRKWSDEDKARIVAEIVASGDSVCSVARAAPSRFCGLRRICWICCSWFFPCGGGLCAAKSRHNPSPRGRAARCARARAEATFLGGPRAERVGEPKPAGLPLRRAEGPRP